MTFQTAIQELHRKIDSDFAMLDVEINTRHQNEDKLHELTNKLNHIIGLLNPYLNNHSEFLGWVKKFFLINELPFQKRNLVEKYLKQFESLRQNFKKIDSMSPAKIEGEMQRIARALSNEHASLSQREDDDQEFKNIPQQIQSTVDMERIAETKLEEDI